MDLEKNQSKDPWIWENHLKALNTLYPKTTKHNKNRRFLTRFIIVTHKYTQSHSPKDLDDPVHVSPSSFTAESLAEAAVLWQFGWNEIGVN